MNNKLKKLTVCVYAFFISSCVNASDKGLTPPSDTNWVNVEVKNPSPYTNPFPLEVVYVSLKCMKTSVNGVDGSLESKPSYNVVKLPFRQQSGGGIWRTKIAMNGGGSCDWHLSEFNMGIEYIDVAHLGQHLVPGTAVGATVAFDDIAARNGKFDNVMGNNLEYSPKYYPVIERWSEKKKSTRPDEVSLFGKETAFWNVYMHVNTNNDVFVKFHPIIDEHKVVEMKLPYEKKKGAMITFIYPNGDVVATKNITPDFYKLEGIK